MKRKTVSVHFRLWDDVYNSLQMEARSEKVNLNTLLNQVLSTHTRDDLLLQEEGFVKAPDSTLRATLKLIPDDKLSEWGTTAVQGDVGTRTIARSGAINLDSALEELRFGSRCGWFRLDERNEEKRKISLVHEFGPKYSVFLGAAITAGFAQLGLRPKITSTDSSIMIEY